MARPSTRNRSSRPAANLTRSGLCGKGSERPAASPPSTRCPSPSRVPSPRSCVTLTRADGVGTDQQARCSPASSARHARVGDMQPGIATGLPDAQAQNMGRCPTGVCRYGVPGLWPQPGGSDARLRSKRPRDAVWALLRTRSVPKSCGRLHGRADIRITRSVCPSDRFSGPYAHQSRRSACLPVAALLRRCACRRIALGCLPKFAFRFFGRE